MPRTKSLRGITLPEQYQQAQDDEPSGTTAKRQMPLGTAKVSDLERHAKDWDLPFPTLTKYFSTAMRFALRDRETRRVDGTLILGKATRIRLHQCAVELDLHLQTFLPSPKERWRETTVAWIEARLIELLKDYYPRE